MSMTRIARIAEGEYFVTALTGRVGIVVGQEDVGVSVSLSAPGRRDPEEKVMHPDVLVRLAVVDLIRDKVHVVDESRAGVTSSCEPDVVGA
jgi:hypothetical protein